MKTSVRYTVRSVRPPIVEIDTGVKAAYVRFSNRPVVETKEVPSAGPSIVTIDLDRQGQVVGIELIGVSSFEINVLLKRVPVSVERPEILGRASYVSAAEAHRKRSRAASTLQAD